MSRRSEGMSCYEAIVDVDAAMRSAIGNEPNYFVLGGIASSALKHSGIVFNHATQTISASAAASEGTIRPNGTVRDIDILVDRVMSDSEAAVVVAEVEEAVRGELVVSVFGFERYQPQERFGGTKSLFTDWISQRTIDDAGVRRYELGPLSQEVAEGSYAPWELVTESGSSVSVLNPAGHVLAYGLRSISGVRAKDVDKLDAMLKRVLDEPEFEKAITQGDYRAWLDFAVSIYNLRDGIDHSEIGIIARGAFRFKGRLLGLLEANEGVVERAQSGKVQDLLGYFVHAK
ncbi:MAG: hypothetical protein U0520_00255 [Candidatus Saccharimonadales bacterium]